MKQLIVATERLGYFIVDWVILVKSACSVRPNLKYNGKLISVRISVCLRRRNEQNNEFYQLRANT